MEQEFIPYKLALELRELGFDEPCFGYYDNPENSVWITLSPPYYANKENVNLAPLYQQAFRWFRGQNIPFSIVNDHSFNLTPYTFTIDHEYYYDSGSGNPWYETYEEAEIECLKKLIEIVKSKQE